MNDPDPSFDRARRALDAFAGMLYNDSASSSEHDEESSAPMFEALSLIMDRYEKPERIGRGGMKEIYRVYDKRAARHVAMARPAPTLDLDDFDAFLREAHLTARLDHSGIIKLFDMGVGKDGRPFFTMEFKKGRSLREILRESDASHDQFPLRKRLEVFLRVCESVAYAHRHRVLHLDIKPENIQIGEFGEVQLCDWGMGVVMPPDGESAEAEDVLLDPDLYGPLLTHFSGTPGYMAPEQEDSRVAKSIAMDIHALGRVLGDLVQDTDSGKDTSGVAIRSIIAKATESDPQRRYASVGELHDDLSRHLAGYSTSVEDAGFVREARLFYRRNRVPCLVTAGLLLTIVAGAFVFVGRLKQSQREALIAQQDAEQALADYLAATQESDRRLGRQAKLAVGVSDRISRLPLFYDDGLPQALRQARAVVDEVIALDPPRHSPAWYQSFWLHFMMQELDQAVAIRGKDLSEVADLVVIAEKHVGELNADGYLDAPDFASLLEDLTISVGPTGGRLPMIECMLAYDEGHPRTPDERIGILTRLLTAINPACDTLVMSFDPESKALQVKGRGLEILSLQEGFPRSGLSLLRFLDPLQFDLSGTSIRNLHELDGLHLHTLDLCDTPVSDLSPLATMRSLRSVTVTRGRFEPADLEKLPGWIGIVDR